MDDVHALKIFYCSGTGRNKDLSEVVNMEVKGMDFTRRNFIKATATCVAASAAAAALGGCAPDVAKAPVEISEGTPDAGQEVVVNELASHVTETIDCDIVVVGSGASGLAATVEALNGGANVLTLEASDIAGGNGNHTSVVMASGSRIQQNLGIDVQPYEIISEELLTFNYDVDGSRWASLVANSAANIDWLIEQGALMCEDLVDNYKGTGILPTGHWWVGETQRDGFNGYVAPFVARIEELGGTIMLETRARELYIGEDGLVAGVFAETLSGDILQVNASAVILATGGYHDNTEMLAERDYSSDRSEVWGSSGTWNGDGINMVIKAGAKSWMKNSSLLEYPMNPKAGRVLSSDYSRLADAIWINERCERYTDENCGAKIIARPALAVRSQEYSYTVFDQTVIDNARSWLTQDKSPLECLNEVIEEGFAFKADLLKSLPKKPDLILLHLPKRSQRITRIATRSKTKFLEKILLSCLRW